MTKAKPIVCTLSLSKLAARGEQWKDLVARAAQVIEHVPGGVAVRFARSDEALAEIEELARLERSCCEWMTLEIRRSVEAMTLLMTADSEEGVEVIRRMVQ